MIEGFGSGWHKNIWILWIRIQIRIRNMVKGVKILTKSIEIHVN
jgi:hypothetical protein